jgi:hypothetical protein
MGPADIGVSEFVLFRSFHDRRLQKAWEIHHWPELCPTEQRTFRAQWLGSTTYAATTEVYDVPTGKYFQSLQAGNLNNAPTIAGVENSAWWAECQTGYSAALWLTAVAYNVGDKVQNPGDLEYYQCFTAHTSGGSFDATKFGLLTPFDRYVSLDQVNADGSLATPIGEVFRATDKNPKLTTKVVDFPYWLSENGVQFSTLKHAISFAWLYFRKRRPALVGDAWDSTASYSSGRQVYYVGVGSSIVLGVGNFYTATTTTAAGESPETTPAKWSLVQLPYIFRGYLITGGFADWLTGDGQANKAVGYETMAVESLELEADKLQRQQGQVRRMQWAN